MSFRKENVQKQTAFRLAALANGYAPLPNHDKRCMLRNWPQAVATPELIEKWATKLVYQGTGLLVTGGMCALDIDIDDAAMVERIWNRAAGKFPQLREALIRYGSGAKEMWVCRTDEPFSAIFSTLHVKPGGDPEQDGVPAYRLEAFGGGHARQIGAFGAHTMKADNSGFAVEYTWADGESPADVRLDALPVVPKAAVLAIAEIACEELSRDEWPRVRKSKVGEVDLSVSYDLVQEMRFDCIDGVTRSLEELKSYAETAHNARCSGSWSGDATMVNRTRCLVSLDHTGEVSVLETASWTRHMAMSLADRDRSLSERTQALSEKMKTAGYTFDDETYHDAPASFKDMTLKLFDEWAWCGSHPSPCLPIYRREELAMSLGNFRTTYLPYAYEREGPKGGVKKITPVDAWVNSVQRENVDGYRFMPHRPQGIFEMDGVRAINSYRAPIHERVEDTIERAEYVSVWEDFMVHLLPDEAEREWFCDWLAYKHQNLRSPGVGVIMYAAPFGVGRGTLFEFISAVFGDEYVTSVSGDTLMGSNSQSQYTDWMANTLIVTTDEVLPDGEEGTSMAWRRKKAYEKLKERIDPKPRRMEILRKTLPNYNDWVYASFLLATNHNNAIPIPDGDRRLAVLTNGIVPLIEDAELMRRINEQRNPDLNPRFISTLARWLNERDVSAFNAHVAPRFKGKSAMQEANLTELDGLVQDVMGALPYDWVTLDAFLDRVEHTLVRMNLKDSFPHWRKVATDQIKSSWTLVGRQYVDLRRETKRTILTRNPRGVEQFRGLDISERDIAYREMRKPEFVASERLREARERFTVV